MAEHVEKIKERITPKFCEKILRDSERDRGIVVKNISVGPATNKGDNYTSDMFRVAVEYSSSTRVYNKKTIIVKVEPMTEGMQQDMISKSPIFDNEIVMLKETLVKMNEILGAGSDRLSAQAFYTEKNPTMLVMEDLMPYGFRMADRQAGLDLEHSLMAIRNLARFHGSSVALCEKDDSIRKKHNCGMFNERQPEEMKMLFSMACTSLSKQIPKWPECDPSYAKKVADFADKVYQTGIKAGAVNEDEFNVLNHGDYWVNNMLYKYDENNKPIQHIFVDFQFAVYGSPVIDLLYFFATSVNEQILTDFEDTLLVEYLKHLSMTMSRSGCKSASPTLDELKKTMRDRHVYGMITSFMITPLVLVDKNACTSINERVEGGNPAYAGATYRKVIVKRLKIYDQMGLLG